MSERLPLRVQPKQPRALTTINQILDAAAEILRDSGRDKFRMQDVARTSGVAIGSVYRYFPDRNSLLDFIWPDRGDTLLPANYEVPRPSL